MDAVKDTEREATGGLGLIVEANCSEQAWGSGGRDALRCSNSPHTAANLMPLGVVVYRKINFVSCCKGLDPIKKNLPRFLDRQSCGTRKFTPSASEEAQEAM